MLEIIASEDIAFAENIAHENMQPFFTGLDKQWDSAGYRRSWHKYDNYEICLDGHKVGVIRTEAEGNVYHIRDLQILTTYQGKGIGKQAIGWAIQTARATGCKTISLSVFINNPALDFYRKLGFKHIHEESGMYFLEHTI